MMHQARSDTHQRVPVDPATKSINLALQGGGAHGALTWGVLDRLIEDDRITIEGISATSAGAMNAAVFTYGYAVGGRDGAKRALDEFWQQVSAAGKVTPLAEHLWPPPWPTLWRSYAQMLKPIFEAMGRMTFLVSPYEFNPWNINPLKDVLERIVDFDVLQRADCPLRLFLSATNVRTGKIKVFEKDEVTADAVLASACLPMLFQAVKIGDEHYWDGGYMGNPALFPLIYNCKSSDIVIVHINPLERSDLPRSAFEILNRMNEISFNSSLLREMRAIGFVTGLIENGSVVGDSLRHVHIHSIEADEIVTKFNASSTFNSDWSFLTELREVGRRFADTWLAANYDRLGKESTTDVARYL
jgi:NTE family protein